MCGGGEEAWRDQGPWRQAIDQEVVERGAIGKSSRVRLSAPLLLAFLPPLPPVTAFPTRVVEHMN